MYISPLSTWKISRCAPDEFRSTPSFSVCGADSAASDTENAFFFVSFVDCVAVCDIRTFDNEHLTAVFSAIFPSIKVQSLSLLLCELGEIAMNTDLWIEVSKCGEMTNAALLHKSQTQTHNFWFSTK